MSETRTLWQRCEALGQLEDFRDKHLDMHFEDERWVIHHDGHPIAFIYEDCMQGSPWLAEAILCHIERIRFPIPTIKPLNEMGDDEKAAFMKAMSEWTCGPMTFVPGESVVTIQNINEKLREAFGSGQYDHDTDGRHRDPNFKGVPIDSVPLPIPNKLPDVTYVANAPQEPLPTLTKRKALFEFLCSLGDCYKGDGVTILIDSVPKAKVIVGGHSIATQYGPKHGHAFVGSVEFNEVCKLAGFVEAPKPTEPTQEQLKAIWDHVTHLTGEQAESFGFRYAVIGNSAQANFELHIKSLGSRFGEWQIKIMHGHIGRYWWENPFDLVTTARLINMAITIPTEQYVTESPLQFVSIPVTEWQQLREAHKTIQSILFPEIKDVEFES